MKPIDTHLLFIFEPSPDQICDSMVMLSAKLVERAQVLIKTKKSMFGSEDKTEKYVYNTYNTYIINNTHDIRPPNYHSVAPHTYFQVADRFNVEHICF